MDSTDSLFQASRSVNNTLTDLSNIYLRKIDYYQKSCRKLQLIFNVLSMLSIVLNISGTLVGTSMARCKAKDKFCESKIALGVLSGFGILLQAFLKLYEYEKKIYYRKLAVTQYKQIYNKIEAYKRTGESDKTLLSNFITEINILEDLISDVCPLVKINPASRMNRDFELR